MSLFDGQLESWSTFLPPPFLLPSCVEDGVADFFQ